jgi:hypothetical protein
MTPTYSIFGYRAATVREPVLPLVAALAHVRIFQIRIPLQPFFIEPE